jgi:hypothetical protein
MLGGGYLSGTSVGVLESIKGGAGNLKSSLQSAVGAFPRIRLRRGLGGADKLLDAPVLPVFMNALTMILII